ncbi:MAG: hypothetical protein KF767_15855 [Bdellovibrionaceae bacterium]|nr:hypothetical protein [Pseudobdellovibrionaceae bacterium]
MSYKVVILKAKPQALKQAEQFLRNRQWQIITTTNLRDAIAAVIQKQPEFVLIAADHPNRKARVLPKLIGQAFPVKVIGFVEASTNASMAILQEMGLEYNVFPPVSGPAIERTILKIKKDEEKKELDRQRAIENGTYMPESNSGTTSVTGEGFNSAREMLARLANGDESPDEAGFIAGSAPSAAGPAIAVGANSDGQVGGSGGDPAANAANPELDDDSNNPYASSWDTMGSAVTPGATNSEDSTSEKGSSRKRKDGPIMEHGPIARKARKQPTYKQDPANYPDRESLIVKGTQEALEQSVLITEGDPNFEEVTSATNVACITISSPRFSGYLVAALGADRKIDDEFLKSVQDRLFSFLRANGEKIDDDNGMNLKLEQVDFEEWAIAQANFLRKSVHGTNEIAMAFFPSKETETKLEQSVAENMLKLGIDELHDDVPVEFDLYIYLPSNKKYLLYTPQGRKLFGAQRGRLRNKGVTHMHLRKDSASQVKRYRAQVYLNEMIGSFKRGGGSGGKKAA